MSRMVLKSHSNQGVFLNALFLMALLFVGKADPMAIVFAYVLETIIIGVIHVVKLFLIVYANPVLKSESKIVNYIMIPFFWFHYGFFVCIQTLFLYLGFAIKDDRFSTSLNISNFIQIFELEGFYWVAISLVLTHFMGFYFNFYKTKKFVGEQFSRYFMKPYLRIFIQQFLAIVPFIFLIFYDNVGLVAALFLIFLRAILDWYLNALATNPEKLRKIALSLVKNKNDPEELIELQKTVQVFCEE